PWVTIIRHETVSAGAGERANPTGPDRAPLASCLHRPGGPLFAHIVAQSRQAVSLLAGVCDRDGAAPAHGRGVAERCAGVVVASRADHNAVLFLDGGNHYPEKRMVSGSRDCGTTDVFKRPPVAYLKHRGVGRQYSGVFAGVLAD